MNIPFQPFRRIDPNLILRPFQLSTFPNTNITFHWEIEVLMCLIVLLKHLRPRKCVQLQVTFHVRWRVGTFEQRQGNATCSNTNGHHLPMYTFALILQENKQSPFSFYCPSRHDRLVDE